MLWLELVQLLLLLLLSIAVQIQVRVIVGVIAQVIGQGGVVHGLCGAFKGFECVCAAKAKARQMQIEMKRNYKIIENYRR